MTSLRTLLRGVAPRVSFLRWQAPLSQTRGLTDAHSGDLPRDGLLAAAQSSLRRGAMTRAGPSLAPDEATSASSLPLASRSGAEKFQTLAWAPARALHGSSSQEKASERSPSGEWPSAPVGFERDWPPRGGTPVVIAMGGNVGDRVANFRMGLRLLRQVSAS